MNAGADPYKVSTYVDNFHQTSHTDLLFYLFHSPRLNDGNDTRISNDFAVELIEHWDFSKSPILALDLADFNRKVSEYKRHVLLSAIYNGYSTSVIKSLVAKGAPFFLAEYGGKTKYELYKFVIVNFERNATSDAILLLDYIDSKVPFTTQDADLAAWYSDLLREAFRGRQTYVLNWFLAKGGKPDTFFHKLAAYLDFVWDASVDTKNLEAIVKAGAPYDNEDDNGRTPLNLFSRRCWSPSCPNPNPNTGFPQIVDWLLQNTNTRIDHPYPSPSALSGKTPLCVALKLGDVGMAAVLKAHGATCSSSQGSASHYSQ